MQPIVKIPTVVAGIIITVDGQVTLLSVIGNDTVIAVGSVAVMVVTVRKVKEDTVELPWGMVPWPGSVVLWPGGAGPWPWVLWSRCAVPVPASCPQGLDEIFQ